MDTFAAKLRYSAKHLVAYRSERPFDAEFLLDREGIDRIHILYYKKFLDYVHGMLRQRV